MRAFLITLVVGGVVIAVILSSPNSSHFFDSFNTGNTSRSKQSQKSTQNNSEMQRANNVAQGLSPFTGYVVIKNLINPEEFVNTEYVTIGSRTTNVPVNITGWSITSKVTGKKVFIGTASPLPKITPEQPIIINSNEDVLLLSGGSPINESFRINSCTGYFNEDRQFTPYLPKNCPQLSRNSLPNAIQKDDTCLRYVNSFNYCQSWKEKVPENLPSFCSEYVKERLSYGGCVNQYQNDPSFYKPEWRVYLNSKTSLWLNSGERLDLFDAQGKLVDTFPH